jgi:hypothetical protein
VRLLGKGVTQQQAIAEILAFPVDDQRRRIIPQLLATWKISVEITDLIEPEDQVTMALLSAAYLEWEQRTEQRGMAERSLILRQLTRRLGELPTSVKAQIDGLAMPQLEQLGDALLDFASLADLVDWLAALA